MEQMLAEALQAGFVGMSSQQLLFDKIDGETCRSRTLPSTYAKPRELRRLKSMLRRSGRILQAGPDIQNPLNIGSQVVQSLGIFRKPLKTSLLSAADIKANPFLIATMGPAARLINTLGGDFRWQHLPVPFEVYADGIDLDLRGVRRRGRHASERTGGPAQRPAARPKRIVGGSARIYRQHSTGLWGVASRLLRRRNRRLPRSVRSDRKVVRAGRY